MGCFTFAVQANRGVGWSKKTVLSHPLPAEAIFDVWWRVGKRVASLVDRTKEKKYSTRGWWASDLRRDERGNGADLPVISAVPRRHHHQTTDNTRAVVVSSAILLRFHVHCVRPKPSCSDSNCRDSPPKPQLLPSVLGGLSCLTENPSSRLKTTGCYRLSKLSDFSS